MIIVPDIQGQSFAVLGLGKSGLATALSLEASGAHVLIWDDKPEARAEAEKAGFSCKDLMSADLTPVKALLLSPGIPHTYPKPHPFVSRCREANIPVIGDVEMLFRACPNATYVGITGTNGKSTTTALIAHILKLAGKTVQVGGNLGTAVLSFEPLEKDGIFVIELSSYQLELIQKNLISVAVLLNITPDHLARHGGMDGYIAAKARIFNTASVPQTLVIGSDEPETRTLLAEARLQPNVKIEEISVTHPVSEGVMMAGQQLFSFIGEEDGGPVVALPLLPTLPGPHNAQNACAAFAACRALGLDKKTIVAGLKSFPGLEHRQQVIGIINSVRFINDSKATNADAASKALACYDDIYWIIGGQAKEGGLRGLEHFAPRIRHAFLIGEASELFAAWCKTNAIPATLCTTLTVATRNAAQMAWTDKKPKAVVLLSPACASWDQFKSFEERGRLFTTLVGELAAQPAKAAS